MSYGDQEAWFKLHRLFPDKFGNARYPLNLMTRVNRRTREFKIEVFSSSPESGRSADNDSMAWLYGFVQPRVGNKPATVEIESYYNDYGPHGGYGTPEQRDSMRGVGKILMRAAVDALQRSGLISSSDPGEHAVELRALPDAVEYYERELNLRKRNLDYKLSLIPMEGTVQNIIDNTYNVAVRWRKAAADLVKGNYKDLADEDNPVGEYMELASGSIVPRRRPPRPDPDLEWGPSHFGQ
eukprot:tig00021745_g23375.t1